MAYIDELAAIAANAVNSEDDALVNAVAHSFYERFSGFAECAWIPSTEKCTAFSFDRFGFTLSFGDRKLKYNRDGKRWLVSECGDRGPDHWCAHDVAVHRFSAPFSFLEGMAFLVECLLEIGEDSVEEQKVNVRRFFGREFDRLEEEKEQHKKTIKVYLDLCADIRSMEQRLKSPRITQQAKKRCVIVANDDDDVPPPPPRETMSIDVTRAAMAGVSGCYFLWDDDKIDYVGQAGCIAKRLSPSHHRLQPHHRVSVVEMPEDRSVIAESYYIWRYEPPLNGPIAESRRIAEKMASRSRKATA